MITKAPEEVFTIPPLADAAVTDAPLTAFVPISIFTLPEEAAVLDILPRSITPLPDTTMLSTGRMRPLTTIPLIDPDALPGNTSFHVILDVSAPLHWTLPLPITAAHVVETDEEIRETESATTVTAPTRIRVFICVFI